MKRIYKTLIVCLLACVMLFSFPVESKAASRNAAYCKVIVIDLLMDLIDNVYIRTLKERLFWPENFQLPYALECHTSFNDLK